MREAVPNMLYTVVQCGHCGKKVDTGIGFKVGKIAGLAYKLGDKIVWDGAPCRPSVRPSAGSLKTIGYFECDNLSCPSWHDCYPDVQEAVIVISNDSFAEAKTTVHRPGEIVFDIIEPEE